MSNKELSFEAAVKSLEKIVAQLEQEDVPLEKAIELYQEGMNLSKLCDTKLQDAQDKVVKILNNNKEESFDLQEE